MNWFDFVLLGGVLLSTYWSLRQGFIMELTYFLAFVFGLLAAFVLYPAVVPFVATLTGQGDFAKTFSFLAVFIFSAVFLVLMGLLCHNFVHFIKLGFLDRLAGAVLGLIRGLVVVGIVVVILVAVTGDRKPAYVDNSLFCRPAVKVTSWSMERVPFLFNQFSKDYLDRAEEWLEKFKDG